VLVLLGNINLRQSNDECEYKGFGFVWEAINNILIRLNLGLIWYKPCKLGRIIDT
jgi:hypothetical protein